MKRPFNLCVCLLAASLILAPTAAQAEACKDYQHQQTKDLVALVQDAVALIKAEGEAAFKQFRKKGSKWFQGQRYIFIDTLEGVEVFNAAFPQVEGQDLWDLMDANNKYIVRSYVREVSYAYKSHGWSHYLWPKPGQTQPQWKTVYVARVRAPTGKYYVVGSGLYDMKAERCFAVDAVENAVELLKSKGTKAYHSISSKSGDFVFRNTYVFIIAADGEELVNPAFPRLVGRNVLDTKDSQGVYMVRDMIKLVKAKGAGWVSYLWPKPGTKKPVPKHAYVKGVTVDGRLLVVGCGIYLP